MPTLSLRSIAEDCLDITPGFSVINDVFGYPFGTPNRTMSLNRQLELIQGEAVDLNVIRVGLENFTDGNNDEIQFAIQIMREIFSDVNIGVRKLHWQHITVADAGSYVTINSTGEATDLTDDWNGIFDDASDMFVVRLFNAPSNGGNFIGWSAVDGPCDKDDWNETTGSTVSLQSTSGVSTGILFAHEIGHYLGLDHCQDDDNCDPATNNFMNSSVNSANVNILNSQGNNMRNHCFVLDRC